MNHPEHELQKACVSWFKMQYSKYKDSIFAIPNGGKRTPQGGRYMKDEGLLPGVSDLFIAVPYNGCHGFFIEMKTPSNLPTPAQIEFLNNMKKRGYNTAVCYSVNGFMDEVEAYFNVSTIDVF